jgi:hypothetical protein
MFKSLGQNLRLVRETASGQDSNGGTISDGGEEKNVGTVPRSSKISLSMGEAKISTCLCMTRNSFLSTKSRWVVKKT